MNKKLLEIISGLKGSLLGIGLNDDNLLDAIEKNDEIYACYLLTNISKTSKKFSMTKRGKNKKINIKKIKKYFRRKSLNTIICNFDIIKQFQRSFVPNSVYLNCGTLYIYGKKEKLECIKLKYQRYTDDISITQVDGCYIMRINNKNSKNNIFKDSLFKIKDFGSDTLELITDILIN